jgi:hypothetical protein
VALLPSPFTHGLGLQTGSTTVGGGLAGTATTATGLDFPGAFHESSDGLVELLDVFAREINFVVGSVDGEGECPLRRRAVDVVNELSDYFCAMAAVSLRSTPLRMTR